MGERKKTVGIVALGPSSLDYIRLSEGLGNRDALFDEVWAINTLASVIKCDIVFHMDDIRVQMARAEAGNVKIANLVECLRTYQGRVITSRPHPDFPCLEAFPLADIMNTFKTAYLNSTVAYAVAYAIYKGFESIALYGCDYHYQGSSSVEPGRACLEYWIGRAWERGIDIRLAPSTTLMDTNSPLLYGYDTLDVAYRVAENGVIEVKMTPKEGALNAEEIEKRYDHKRKVA